MRDCYTKAELQDLTLNAGLSRLEAMPHIDSQFRRIYSNEIDIFAMEGLPDEHLFSTGISDCKTDYSNLEECPADGSEGAEDGTPLTGVRVCPTKNCDLPNPSKFEDFFTYFDITRTAC